MCSTFGDDCSKAVTSFAAISDAFKSDGLDWDNVASVGLDKTNMRSRNSLRTEILAENPPAFIAECNFYLAHLGSGKGGELYAFIIKFDCEDHQADLYYFFKWRTR